MSRQPDRGQGPDSGATYVFAVCGRIAPSALTALPGLAENSPVRALPFGDLTAVVQHVDAAEFTEEAWQERLLDERELERCARAHHQVVSAAAACGPTVPLALATLYRTDERACSALQQDIERFRNALRRIDGRVELGVKVYAPTAVPPRAEPPRTPGIRDTPAPGAGRAYLERKRGLHQEREQCHTDALRTADTVDSALLVLAAAGRRLRAHGQKTSEARGVQVLNATYLVEADRAGEFGEAVRSLQGRTGASIEMTGPWVPYSFAGEV
ncbi:GvpL/GvpF family gas vesicle protein [Streptomyces sp. NBC_01497]|uniref:GvpL/GvpF family gas vesicle protein n=1 Tax=Streptomyces sp. NBC_01497 TaxID=2903885 RepID=UPI002E30EED9|nr:GvpL/GvpF family gas vesicle protein [Streptomyces sp. NBC_01497]